MTASEGGSILWVDRGAVAIEIFAVAIILSFILIATFIWLHHVLARHEPQREYYECYRRQLARCLLIGLEILVAADIVRTVALNFTLVALFELGLLVLIRTFLGWSIVVELEGRWPWQPRAPGITGEKEL